MENTANKTKRCFWGISIAALAAASGTLAFAGQSAGLRTVTFPDGSGSIGLAPGWQTNALTATRGMALAGPGGARVLVQQNFSIIMPSNPASRMAEGRIMVARFAAPAEAMAEIGPQLSRNSEMHGGPAMRFDSFAQVQTTPSSLPRGSAAIVTYGVTESGRLGPRHYRATALIETAPSTVQGWWIMRLTEGRAPDATFDRDLPAMRAMAASLHVDEQAATAAMREAVQQQIAYSNFARQMMAVRQRGDEERRRIISNAHSDIAKQRVVDSKARAEGYYKNNADADENLRGRREIEDRRTGERATVDLGYSGQIVDELNQYTADPGRFQERPLRNQ